MWSTSSPFSASAVWSVTTQLWKYNGVQMTCRLGDGNSYAYLEISMIVVVEGVEIRGRSWDVGTSPPPLDMESTNTSWNRRGQRGCVIFNVALTLHFNTSNGKEQEERHRT